MSNRRVSKPRDRSAKSLAKAKLEAPSPTELRKQVNRLEVDIAATSRLDFERRRSRRDTLPPPEHMRKGTALQRQARLTYDQARRKRRKMTLQAAMFLTTLILFAGAAAWVYQMWQHGFQP